VALDQHYIDPGVFDSIYSQADKTGRIISGLITYLRTRKPYQPNRPEKPDKSNKRG
jgi:hypothetical protein